MKAIDLVKKLGSKLLGKKTNKRASDKDGGGLANITSIAPDGKKPSLVFDGMNIIRLNEHWRN